MKDLAGKTAVITGGGSGIGLALAKRFAQEKMRVVIADIYKPALQTAAAELKAAGADVLAVHTDVTQMEEVEDLARQTFGRFGGAHILCNNAGVMTGGLCWQHDPKDWEWVFRVNVWGVVHGLRAFIPRLIKQPDEAHIVNTASVAGLVSNPYLGIYTAAKHAVVGITETLAVELSLICPRISASVLCPGFVATGLADNERTRPSRLALDKNEQVPAGQRMVAEGLRQRIQEGMPAEAVAARALEGIRNKEFCIFTHSEHGPLLERHTRALLSGEVPPFDPH